MTHSNSISIHPHTTVGAVWLTVADLGRSLAYYQEGIGLRLHQRHGSTARLGVGGPDLLVLTEADVHTVQGTTGLYHFALLVPSRPELARTLRHLDQAGIHVGGFSDHAVSEAIYLTDPDGHGIEIYRDRPRSQWEYPGGELKMTVDPFDMEGVLAELTTAEPDWSGLHPDTVMGHIHLHVAHLPQAEQFYVDLLGFDLMTRYGSSAAFISAGGYHHHLGLNTWAGVGAPPPPPDAARLQWFEIRLPDAAALAEVTDRLQAAGIPLSQRDEGFYLEDPSQNGLLLTTRAAT